MRKTNGNCNNTKGVCRAESYSKELAWRIGKVFEATERESFCNEKGIPVTVYDNVLMNLKRYGLVRKEGNYLFLDDEFVFRLLKEWVEFLK